MDTRRFRKQRLAESFERARWLGWVMLMMFVVVQAAASTGPVTSGDLHGARLHARAGPR